MALNFEETATMSLTNMTPEYEEKREGINWIFVPAVCILAVTFIVGLVGNAMVLIAVCLSRRLQTTTNVFVVTLSCADLLNALLLPVQVHPILIYDAYAKGSAHASIVCTTVGALTYIVNGWTVLMLAAIACNRYILITQPLQRYLLIFSRRNITLIVLLALAFPSSLVVIFTVNKWVNDVNGDNLCTLGEGRLLDLLSGGTALICLFSAAMFYLAIYIYIRNHSRKLVGLASADSELTSSSVDGARDSSKVSRSGDKARGRSKMENVITKNLSVTLLCFVICVFPTTMLLFVGGNVGIWKVYPFVILSLNCCLNPIVYGWKHPVFRKVFRSMTSCRLHEIEDPASWLRERLARVGQRNVTRDI